jgi:hypothetical protein
MKLNTTFEARISSVVLLDRAIIIRFTYPADRRPPSLTGYGIGAEWMTPQFLTKIALAMIEAAGAADIRDLEGRFVAVSCNEDGVMEGIVFEDSERFNVVWFPDFCKP